MLTRRSLLLVLFVALVAAMATSQAPRQELTLSVTGYPGEVAVVQSQGRTFVDVQELARITNGSLSYGKQRIVLTLPTPDSPATDETRFSQPFLSTAIESMASIREWGGMLIVSVQRGYPVQHVAAGNTITAYQGRAADSIARASAAASTDADRRALELLRNEFTDVKAWSDNFVKLRSSMRAADLTMNENALRDDAEAQRLLRCGQFLAQMFASGMFQEDAACH